MYLKRIALKRFGALDQQTYTFRPGLNLIKGPNEAGKSTLQAALLFGLFGNPQHTTLQRVKHVDDYTSWGATGSFHITLDIADGAETTYRVEKDWASGDARLIALGSDTVVTGVDAVQQRLNKMLGYGAVKIFQSTACVEQNAVDDLTAGQRTITDQLQRIVTGGGEAKASDALAKLEQEIGTLKKGWKTFAPKHPGPIKRQQDDIARLEERLSTIRAQVRQAEDAGERLGDLEAQIDDLTEKLKARRALRASCDRRFELEDELEERKAQEQKLEARVAQIQQLQEQLVGTEEASRAGGRGQSRLPWITLLGFAAGFLLSLIGLAIGLLRSSVLGLLVGLPGLLIGAGSFVWLVIILVRSQSGDPQTTLRAKLDALLEERPLEAWIEERKEASRQRRDLEETLAEPEMQQAAQVTPVEYETLKQEIARLEEQLEAKEQERIRQEARRDDTTYTLEDVHRLEEQKAAAERALERLKDRLTVYELTYEVLEQAQQETMRSARDELEPKIGQHLRCITHGRYEQVEASDDLALSIFSAEKGSWIDADDGELSRGTIDQLYLAARLALIDLLYQEAQPPLLMDDPFVTFDPQRRQAALRLCREIAQTHQVLFFTCHDGYDGIATEVIAL